MTNTAFSIRESLGGRYWSLRDIDAQVVQSLTPHLGGDDLLARLLAPRGITADKIETFLNPTLRALFPDPASFQDMMKAAELTLDAIVDGRNVTVFADYDVDGGASAALLICWMRDLGLQATLYVPDPLLQSVGARDRFIRAGQADRRLRPEP